MSKPGKGAVFLSDAAHAAVCGLVQSNNDVDADGIVIPEAVWNEIRAAFPLVTFRKAVARGVVEYDPDGAWVDAGDD